MVDDGDATTVAGATFVAGTTVVAGPTVVGLGRTEGSPVGGAGVPVAGELATVGGFVGGGWFCDAGALPQAASKTSAPTANQGARKILLILNKETRNEFKVVSI